MNGNVISEEVPAIELLISKAYFKIDKDFSGKAKYFAKCVIDEAFENSESIGHLTSENDIKNAVDLIWDLTRVLSWGKDRDDDFREVYRDFNWKDVLLSPWLNDDFFIDMLDLEHIISKYLSNKWFSSPTFEWFIINPYLRSFINSYRDSLIYEGRSKRQPLSDSSSCWKYYTQLIQDKLKCITIGAVVYITPPYFISYALNNDWIIIALFALIGYLYTLTSDIVVFFKNKKIKNKQIDTINKLVDLKTCVSGRTWSPENIMSQLKIFDDRLHMQSLTALVSKMTNRDAQVFNTTY